MIDDASKLIWGPAAISLGVPASMRVPPLQFHGGVVPVFYLVVRTLFKGKKKDGADAGPDVLGNDSHKEISAS